MNRRSLLGSAGAAVTVAGVGCLGSSDSEAGEPGEPGEPGDSGTEPADGSSGIEPKPYPDAPETASEESVVTFVAAYEEAHRHNQLLHEDTTDISVGCPAAIDLETERGFYVLTICHGSSRSGDVVGDLGPDPAFYFVADGTFQRVGDVAGERGDEYGNGRGSTEVQGFRIANFDDAERRVAVTLVHRTDSATELVLEESSTLPAESALSRSAVVATEGEFELTIDLGGGQSATFDWQLSDLGPAYGVNGYVTTGEIGFGTASHPR